MAFDVITPIQIGQSEVATAPTLTTFRATPASSKDFIKSIDIANNSAIDRTVEVFLVPSGSSADSSTVLIPNATVYANSSISWDGVQILDAGGTVQARASGSDVCVTVSGGNAV